MDCNIWPSIRGQFTGTIDPELLDQIAILLDDEDDLLVSYSASTTDGEFEVWACQECRGPVTEIDRQKVTKTFQAANFIFVKEPVLIPNMFEE